MRRDGLWTSGVNLDTVVRFADPDFLIECKNFSDLATFSVDFCILYAEWPPYFYFRFVWPTDLKSIPHASTPTLIIPTKFEVEMIIHCRVTAFLSADTSHDLVTLTFDLFTFNSYRTWRVTWQTLTPSLKTLRLFFHELRVTTVPFNYHWKCVRGHCACAESRDPWVGGQNNPDPDLSIQYTTLLGSDDDYGSFTIEPSNVKAVFGRKKF